MSSNVDVRSIYDRIELDIFLFGGVPFGRHREHYLQRLALLPQSPPKETKVLEVIVVDFVAGTVTFEEPPS